MSEKGWSLHVVVEKEAKEGDREHDAMRQVVGRINGAKNLAPSLPSFLRSFFGFKWLLSRFHCLSLLLRETDKCI